MAGQRENAPPDLDLAEISGGPLSAHRSIFWYLERGAMMKPDAAAVICMDQPAGHLKEELVHEGSENQSIIMRQSLSSPSRLLLSYEHLLLMAKKVVAGWTARGLKAGITVLLGVPNGAEFCILYWACILMKVTVVCYDPSTMPQLCSLLRTLKPSVVVVDNSGEAIAVDLAVKSLRMPEPLRLQLNASTSRDPWMPLGELFKTKLTSDVEQSILDHARSDDPDRVHSILFTSGTSDKPKGCPLRVAGQTHILETWSWLLDRRTSSRALQQAHNSRAIAPTQMLQTWSNGGAVLLPRRSFHLDDTTAAIESFGATFVVLSPTMVHALVDKIRISDSGSLLTVQIGGDAVTRTVLLKCQAVFPGARICTHHGMSEGVAAFQWPFFDLPVSNIPFLGETCPIGKVARGSKVRVWNTATRSIGRRNEPGELHVQSSSVIRHYLQGASPGAFYDDYDGRWFITGDIATMNGNGTIYILGRSNDCIKRAGYPILPGPLESLIERYVDAQVSSKRSHESEQHGARLLTFCLVTKTCVVSVQDHILTQAVIAVVHGLKGNSEADIIQHVRQNLGERVVLDRVLTLTQLGLDRFPVNQTFKIIRSATQQAVCRYIEDGRRSVY